MSTSHRTRRNPDGRFEVVGGLTMRAAVEAHGTSCSCGMRQPIVYVSARSMMMVTTPEMRTAMTATTVWVSQLGEPAP